MPHSIRPPGVARPALALALALAAGAGAQSRLRAPDFLDDGYHNVVVVDFEELRSTGVWDDICTGATRMLLEVLQREMEMPFEDLDRFWIAPVRGDSGVSVLIVESRVPLGLPEGDDDERRVREKVGAHELIYRDGFSYGSVTPTPKLRITGPLDHLRKKLERTKRPGMPSPDLLSLMSTRRDGVLLHVARDLRHVVAALEALPDVDIPEWPADDRPEFGLFRVYATGSPDDPHLNVELVVRHRKPGEGLERTRAAITSALDDVMMNPRYRFLSSIWKGREWSVDGDDLALRLDLGRARSVTAYIETLAALWLGESGGDLLPHPSDPPVKKQG